MIRLPAGTLLTCALVAGCSTTPTPDSAMVPAKLVMAPELTTARADRGVLVVKRDQGHMGGVCDHEISLDGTIVAKLRPGEGVTMYATAGEHILSFRATGICPGANEISTIAEVGKRRTFRTFVSDNGATLMPTAY